MARDVLDIMKITRNGVLLAMVAADDVNGHEFKNNGRTCLQVSNNNGTAPIDVTIIIPRLVDGLVVTDRVITVSHLVSIKHVQIGPFPEDVYNDEYGNVLLDFSDDTAVNVGAFSI